ncbi:MAG TPA: pyruvate dehydrogenase complex dihydrolipoamide acetyltransferase [Pyrinomonadaceae bacterium]|jgi:pyruvate dehydrogenase E2 component (dihydrolipoamide acetyltransferase)|nr:pyruvate dehydrogenase complex dihydrolipoamide acetyltransferase [Pyrinomonadaceae bacterium]
MATQVVMPKLSPTMEEGQLSRWLKKEGDKVSFGEPIAEIDTDKATMEATATTSGVLRKILVPDGETVPLGAPIAIVGEPDEDISGLLSEASSGAAQAERKESVEVSTEGEPIKGDAGGEPSTKQPEAQTGAGEAKGTQQQQPSTAQTAGNGQSAQGGRLLISPIAARMAADAGINLRELSGSGPNGRIVKRDIEAAMSAAQKQKQTETEEFQQALRDIPKEQVPTTPQTRAAQKPAQPQFPAPQVEGAAPYREEQVSTMRATIARRLVTSIGPVPHFFLTTEIEMDKAAELRRQLNELDPDNKVSINDLIIKIAAVSLMQHPAVNASFQDKVIRYYGRADIGVAVAIEDGLITPVVRGAESKSVGQIAREVRELAERARSRKLKPEEYTGATFSVSNLGMFGIDEFTAVINPPEAAILAVGAMTPKPVVREGQVVVRQLMRVTMSCDHRVVDGATGAKFLQTFKKILENPLYLLA